MTALPDPVDSLAVDRIAGLLREHHDVHHADTQARLIALVHLVDRIERAVEATGRMTWTDPSA